MQASCNKNCKWSRELDQVFSAGWLRLWEPAGDWPRPGRPVAGLLSTVRVPFDPHTLVFSSFVKCSPCHHDHFPLQSLSDILPTLLPTAFGSSFCFRPPYTERRAAFVSLTLCMCFLSHYIQNTHKWSPYLLRTPSDEVNKMDAPSLGSHVCPSVCLYVTFPNEHKNHFNATEKRTTI